MTVVEVLYMNSIIKKMYTQATYPIFFGGDVSLFNWYRCCIKFDLLKSALVTITTQSKNDGKSHS